MLRALVLMVSLVLIGADFPVRTPVVLNVPMATYKNVNIINIPHGEFTFYFTTTDNRIIPAEVYGLQYGADRHNADWKPIPGVKRTMEVNTSIAFYVRVSRFNTYCDLDKLIVLGSTGYRMEIDLDLFWGSSHRFKPGESYAMCMYL